MGEDRVKIGGFGRLWGLPGVSWDDFWASLGALSVVLALDGGLGAAFGPLWWSFGGLLGLFGGPWGVLWATLGSLWAPLGSFWEALGGFWGHFGHPWASLWTLLA